MRYLVKDAYLQIPPKNVYLEPVNNLFYCIGKLGSLLAHISEEYSEWTVFNVKVTPLLAFIDFLLNIVLKIQKNSLEKPKNNIPHKYTTSDCEMAAAAPGYVYSDIMIPLGKNEHSFLRSQGQV